MRTFVLCIFLFVAVVTPKIGTAQVYHLPTPPPQVTAASESWQIQGEPVFYEGYFYYPTGPTVFFDGNVMVRTGVYRGVPLYEDATLEPYSMVFVPVAGRTMRPYERKREGELAGTVGSRPPSFPIQRDAELSVAMRGAGLVTPPLIVNRPSMMPEAERAVRTSGVVVCCSSAPVCCPFASQPQATSPPPAPTVVESVRRPGEINGVWIEFDGARWYNDGAAVSYDPERFVPIGNHRGFPVYRERTSSANRIFVTIVPNGPVAPFARR
jgi:hypothetical protein